MNKHCKIHNKKLYDTELCWKCDPDSICRKCKCQTSYPYNITDGYCYNCNPDNHCLKCNLLSAHASDYKYCNLCFPRNLCKICGKTESGASTYNCTSCQKNNKI